MSDFQKKVNAEPAQGLPGQLVDPSFVPTALGYLSDGTLGPGDFAFTKSTEKGTAQVAYKKEGERLLGVVIRASTGMMNSPFMNAAETYAKGAPVAIAQRGRVYYKVADGAPTIGQSLLVDPSTGAVTFGTAGTANDSGWVVVGFTNSATTAAKGDIVMIENLGVNNK